MEIIYWNEKVREFINGLDKITSSRVKKTVKSILRNICYISIMMKTHKQVMEEFLSDPENKKAYDSLEVEFKIHDALIEARI